MAKAQCCPFLTRWVLRKSDIHNSYFGYKGKERSYLIALVSKQNLHDILKYLHLRNLDNRSRMNALNRDVRALKYSFSVPVNDPFSSIVRISVCVCLSGFCGVKAIQTFTADSSLLSVYFVLSK